MGTVHEQQSSAANQKINVLKKMRAIIPIRPLQDYIKDKTPGISFEMACD